ncbi:MAG TPA: OpgC domain-containing protein, partial [Devosia sp.]|nr:OpgC domain-containing protein [Devosia sp.]
HIGTTAMALGIFAAAALWFGITSPLGQNNIDVLFTQPLGFMVGVPLLTHQLGYFNILPLYLVLLLLTPLLLAIGTRHPWPTLLVSLTLWAAAGEWSLNLPNYPTPGGWFFNPLSWQLIFVIGLLSGVAMRQGRALVPFDRVLFWGALAFVVFVGFWARIDWLAEWGRSLLGRLATAGFPGYFTWFDKTFLALPRLLHALALAYVASSLPIVRSFAESIYAAPLTLLGRHGLPVFATSSVLDMVIQAIKSAIGEDALSDGLMFSAGIGLLLLLAGVLDMLRGGRRRAVPATVAVASDAGAPAASDLAVSG